jgi:hypothetical protein
MNDTKSKHWSAGLPLVQFQKNTALNRNLGMSPYECLFGKYSNFIKVVNCWKIRDVFSRDVFLRDVLLGDVLLHDVLSCDVLWIERLSHYFFSQFGKQAKSIIMSKIIRQSKIRLGQKLEEV